MRGKLARGTYPLEVLMDGSPLEPGSHPDQLRVIDVQVGAHGTIWAHYEVVAKHSNN